jgi:hypothetical protein
MGQTRTKDKASARRALVECRLGSLVSRNLVRIRVKPANSSIIPSESTGHHNHDMLPSPSTEYENCKIPRRRVSIITSTGKNIWPLGGVLAGLPHSEQISNASPIGTITAAHGDGFRLQMWLELELQAMGYMFLVD